MTPQTPVQPKLSDLLSRYLNQRSSAHSAGLASFDSREVTPYEAGPVQPIDPKPAWDEALTVLQHYPSSRSESLSAPPHWPQLVAGHEPVVALAWCVGNFPQLVRNFHQILHHANLSELRPMCGRPVSTPALLDWAQHSTSRQEFPGALLALGALRLSKQFDQADALVAKLESNVPASWRAAWDNELAALAWHRGESEEAMRRWAAAKPSLPVLFNRGMAYLFFGQLPAARDMFKTVIERIPESSGWHHLASLYLALSNQR